MLGTLATEIKWYMYMYICTEGSQIIVLYSNAIAQLPHKSVSEKHHTWLYFKKKYKTKLMLEIRSCCTQ